MVYKWFRATGRALFDGENKPYRMLGTIENIEQRKHAEKESINVQERFQLAVDGANVGIWDWMDVHCSKQYWSPKFYHLLGYEPEEIEPSFENFTSLIHLEDQQRLFNKIDAHFIECVPFEIEYRLQLKDGSYHWFKGSGIASRNALGEPIRMVGSIEDIQKQKSAETQVIATLKKLAASNQNLEQFVYAASHDLQEPIRTVSSYLSLIERRYTDELPSETKEFFSIVTDGCQRMKVLLNDLLEYSQVREGRDLYKTVDLRSVLSKLIKQYNQQNKLSIELNIPNSLVVLGIETYLVRLFGNLLSNAVKYQSPDRVLKVGIKVNETEEIITIHITDNGIGIDEQFFEKIFEIFQRLHSMSEYEGTGIGLSLCKKIVSMHQGDITVKSTLNEGSCFTVTLPKNPNNADKQ